MGRRKVQIKRIENKSSRQVTFCKRRNGLIEKARQLSVLCESSVAVLVVSAIGKLYNSSSGDNNLEEANVDGVSVDSLNSPEESCSVLWTLPDFRLCLQFDTNIQCLVADKINDGVFEDPNLEEANVDGVSVDSLNSPEEQLETALSVTRATKEMIELLQQYLQFGPCLTSDYVSSLTPIFNVLLQTKLMMEFLKTRRE
ncbi:hypothetical protein HID58_054856, partial [Brassica napus]